MPAKRQGPSATLLSSFGRTDTLFPKGIPERGEGTKRSLMHKARQSMTPAGLFLAVTGKERTLRPSRMGTASALPKQILASVLAEILVADAMFLHTQGHDALREP